MANSDSRQRKIWSNVLSIFGAGGCIVVFLWSFGLTGYYCSARPRQPEPERGWTERLPWTYGRYGTYAEREQLLSLHDWFFPFGLVAWTRAWIKMGRKKKEPWRAR